MNKLIRAFHTFTLSDGFAHIVMVLVSVYLAVAIGTLVMS